MMKAHGIAPNAASVRASPAGRAFKAERRESAPAAKKRKADDFSNDRGGAEDDQEHFDNVKPDPGSTSEELKVKEEPEQMQIASRENPMHFFPSLTGDSQEYLSASNTYDHHTTGFDAHTTHGNMYGLSGQSSFMAFNGYEQSDSNGVIVNASQVGGVQLGDSQQESIMIGD
jgi:hypothetical protein